ncbi:pilus assembly protein TadG-related protein [Arthrobacter sp. ov118]|uniref:pilus assembly protein TadG-related protein n=1 Tax=Arthrobacter sp. ov118 TaxID=1761747 RepID=UPI0015A6E0BE|nr:pilus assembly protein TadG-related protein [Arthrobacter sp. ov118]
MAGRPTRTKEPGRRQPGRQPRARPQDGQVLVLIIGFVLTGLLVATVVIAASSVYLEHKKLLSLADGASVAAADSFTLGQLGSAGGTPSAVLSGARVRNAVVDYLGRNGAFARFSALAVAPSTGSPDGATAVVVISASVHPPVVNFLVPDGIRIEARSTARSRLSR